MIKKLATFDNERSGINVGVKQKLYTYQQFDGTSTDQLERWFAEDETRGMPVIADLMARRSITVEQKIDLVVYVALAAYRVPKVIREFERIHARSASALPNYSAANHSQLRRRLRRAGLATSEGHLEELVRARLLAVEQGAAVPTTGRTWALAAAVRSALQLVGPFMEKNWMVLHTDDAMPYITCDLPLVIICQPGHQPGKTLDELEVIENSWIFPITKTCALIMNGQGNQIVHADSDGDDVRDINAQLAHSRSFRHRCV